MRLPSGRAHWAAALLVLTHLIATAGERVTTNEILRYAFDCDECEDGLIREQHHKSRAALKLEVDEKRGAACFSGRQGIALATPANACTQYVTGACKYDPLETSGDSSLGPEFTDGITIEMWLRADVDDPADATLSNSARRSILTLSAETPEDGNGDRCTWASTPIGFELLQDRYGCVYLKVQTGLERCQEAPFTTESKCSAASNPGNGVALDGGATSPQHLVVTLDSAMNATSDRPRFGIYIDGSRVVDSEASSGPVESTFTNTVAEWHLPAPLGLDALWLATHILRIGTDGHQRPDYDTGHYAWGGEVYMVALYSRAITGAEVSQNFGEGVPNSRPTSSASTWTLDEDGGVGGCVQMPDLTLEAADYDNSGLGRGQTLTIVLTSLPNKGSLYEDGACTVPLTELDGALAQGSLYYKPEADETGDPYTTIKWKVRDGAAAADTTLESSEATLTVVVTAVNDEPVATSSSLEAYMTVVTDVPLHGSDVDEATSASQCAECSVRITRAPTYGTVYATGGAGTSLRIALAGTEAGGLHPTPVKNTTLLYQSSTIERGCGKACARLVEMDDFDFVLIDPEGAVSAPATVSVAILAGLDTASAKVTGVDEEYPRVIQLRGLNSYQATDAWFLIEELPRHGRLYQSSAEVDAEREKLADAKTVTAAALEAFHTAAAPYLLASGGRVLDAAVEPCSDDHAWSCAPVVYVGETDYFSNPKQTTDGTLLTDVDDDTFTFTVNTASEVSTAGRTYVEVDNVNDPPSITGPEQIRFGVSYSAGENVVSLGKGVEVTDPDRGVGYYQLTMRVSRGQLTELEHRQPGRHSLVAQHQYWQYTLDAIEGAVGYSPLMCCGGSYCSATKCVRGSEASLEPILQVFATPSTAARTIHDVQFSTSTDADGHEFVIEISDFHDGHQTSRAPSLPVVRLAIPLQAEVTCSSYVGTTCQGSAWNRGEGGCGGGLVSTAIFTLALSGIGVAWIYACCRQRGRTAVRNARGRRKPERQQATPDMRCWVPLLATLGLAATLLAFLARANHSAYALYRLDIYGDGFCGANATAWTPERVGDLDGASPLAIQSSELSGGVVANRTEGTAVDAAEGGGEMQVAYNNHGCTGGVPAGFDLERMLGDLLGVGVVGNLLLIELSGREGGRALVGSLAALMVLISGVKLALFNSWEDQIPEPKPAGCAACTNFLTLIDDDDAERGYTLGECSNDIRPFQRNAIGAVLPAVGGPAVLILLVVCRMGLRGCRRGDVAESDDEASSDSESDDEHGRERALGRKARKKKDTRTNSRSHDKERKRRKKEKEKTNTNTTSSTTTANTKKKKGASSDSDPDVIEAAACNSDEAHARAPSRAKPAPPGEHQSVVKKHQSVARTNEVYLEMGADL